MKRLALALLAVVLFVGVLVVTFPADRVVQLALARLPPALAGAVEVGEARLALQGLVLADVTVHVGGTDNAAPLVFAPVTLRPSLLGLVTGRRGLPLRADARGCGGEVTVTVDRAEGHDVAAVAFAGVELATCAAPFDTGGPVEGRADGDARLVLDPAAPSGAGTLTLADAHWRPRGVPRHAPLDADHAFVRWTLEGARLRLFELRIANRELAADGAGSVLVRPGGEAPILDLQVRVRPLPAMPQAHHDLLARLPGSPPDAEGARTYRIRGPLDAPQLGAP